MQAAALAPFVAPVTIGIVLSAAAIDLARRRIPNWLTFGAWIAALPVQMVIHGFAGGSLAWLYGWLVGLTLFLPFYLLRGMAAGDVKLLAAVGAWLGAAMVVNVALATCVIGGVWALVQLLVTRQTLVTLSRVSYMLSVAVQRRARPVQSEAEASAGSIPYGVAIAVGTIVMLFAGT
ncbi:prepilin peptidase [Cupriavidus sp. IK-TO18]|uniref:A24 family peptidase n=1 Tax=Cupriavidus sp. IK-TO18 TaxID=2782182 RepID=UPI001899E87B|nr:prepilin peptidase [Cupriavidus sp. IK-TO18]MBF6991669.1 prepilin peptidase [Cupriavidus sp. IK-TO18]